MPSSRRSYLPSSSVSTSFSFVASPETAMVAGSIKYSVFRARHPGPSVKFTNRLSSLVTNTGRVARTVSTEE